MDIVADTLVDIRIKNNDVYVQQKHILKLYDFSRSTLWRLINEMRLIPKYQKAFRDVSPQKSWYILLVLKNLSNINIKNIWKCKHLKNNFIISP